jgi:hypothetical protein
VEHTTSDTNGHKYDPLGAPRWLPIQIHSSESRRIEEYTPKEVVAAVGPRRCLGDGLG